VVLAAIVLAPATALADEPCLLPVACDLPIDLPEADPNDAVEDPVGVVNDTVDDAEETVRPVVDPVLDIVDDVLGGDDPVDPPGGDGGGGHGTEVEGRSQTRGTSTDQLGPTPPSAFAHESTRPAPTLIGSAASGSRPAVGPATTPGGPGSVIGAAVRGLLLLAILFGVAIGFVVLQSRLDRRDPGLTAAPATPEVVTFA
jgi:hypothetical protein